MGRSPAVFLGTDGAAPLACGGAAALVAQAGWPSTLMTVFSAASPRRCPGIAMDLADPAASDAAQRATLQAAEALCAAAVLGCSLRSLELPEAELDPWDAGFAGRGRSPFSDLARQIAREVMSLPAWSGGTQVFVPLATREAPQHTLLFEAGRTLAACGVRVWAYEDVASQLRGAAGVDCAGEQVCAALGQPLLLAIDTVLARKLDAAACLAGEMPAPLRSVLELRAALAGHARGLGGDPVRACERYWPVLG